MRKLVDYYIKPYTIKEIVFINTVKLKLSTTIRIHLVLNVSQVVKYQEPVREQKIKKPKPVKFDNEEEWEVKKY